MKMGGQKSKDFRRRTAFEPDVSACPAKVDHVHISGLNRTCDDYIQRAAVDLFKAKTFQDILVECNKTRRYLNELGIFKDITVKIDVSSGEKATENGYDVTFTGNELSRVVGSIGTEVGQNEGTMTIELTTPNIWGRGERLRLLGSYSNNKTSELTLRLSKPFYHTYFGNYKPELSIGLFRNITSMPVSAYKAQNFGLIGDFKFTLPLSWPVANSLQYELSFREISLLNKHSPFYVHTNCGPRMASLIRHIASFDQRDNNVFPTQGAHVKCTNELSGIGGNISYVMSNVHGEISLPLFAGISAQLTSRLGIVKNLNKNMPELPIGSLYTLGGPLTLRGFQFGGVGPHCDGYAIGAYSYWAAGLHLWSPLPFCRYLGQFEDNFKLHLFYNFGNCNAFSTYRMRSAAGIGIAVKLGELARFEVNYCYPLNSQAGDRIQSGLQFGIGCEFI